MGDVGGVLSREEGLKETELLPLCRSRGDRGPVPLVMVSALVPIAANEPLLALRPFLGTRRFFCCDGGVLVLGATGSTTVTDRKVSASLDCRTFSKPSWVLSAERELEEGSGKSNEDARCLSRGFVKLLRDEELNRELDLLSVPGEPGSSLLPRVELECFLSRLFVKPKSKSSWDSEMDVFAGARFKVEVTVSRTGNGVKLRTWMA